MPVVKEYHMFSAQIDAEFLHSFLALIDIRCYSLQEKWRLESTTWG
jgi:hypothetical protein